MPTVLMGSAVSGAPYDLVALDDLRAGAMAAGHLLELGHRRIVVIGGRRGASSHGLRVRGCRAAFRAHGLELAEGQIRCAKFTSEEAYEQTLLCMGTRAPPTALISLSNFMTIGVIRALNAIKRRCPKDVSLIGIDDLDWADIMSLRPTLIAQPIEEMTRAAIAALLSKVVQGSFPSNRQLLFAPRLVERASCARWQGEPTVGLRP